MVAQVEYGAGQTKRERRDVARRTGAVATRAERGHPVAKCGDSIEHIRVDWIHRRHHRSNQMNLDVAWAQSLNPTMDIFRI